MESMIKNSFIMSSYYSLNVLQKEAPLSSTAIIQMIFQRSLLEFIRDQTAIQGTVHAIDGSFSRSSFTQTAQEIFIQTIIYKILLSKHAQSKIPAEGLWVLAMLAPAGVRKACELLYKWYAKKTSKESPPSISVTPSMPPTPFLGTNPPPQQRLSPFPGLGEPSAEAIASQLPSGSFNSQRVVSPPFRGHASPLLSYRPDH